MKIATSNCTSSLETFKQMTFGKTDTSPQDCEVWIFVILFGREIMNVS